YSFATVPYAERIQRTLDELSQLDRLGARIANMRGLLFAGCAAGVGLILFGKLGSGAWWGVGAAALAYVGAAWRHQRIVEQEARAKIRLDLNRRGAARLTGGWHQFTNRGDRFLDADHLYSPDL